MKKCAKCQVVYHSENRLYCIYCDSRLVTASVYDGLRTDFEAAERIPKKARRPDVSSPERLEYLMGSYFKRRSFSFSYGVSRQDFKQGRGYKRWFVQPLNYSAFMKVPWVAVDILDSLLFRVLYTGYCPLCGCKYIPVAGTGHSRRQCEFNKEYAQIMDNIRSGKIVVNEDQFAQDAETKEGQGLRSAYKMLCSRRSGLRTFMDILSIMISMTLFLYLFTLAVMPFLGRVFEF